MLSVSTEKQTETKGLLSNLLGMKPNLKDDKFSLLLKSFSFGKLDVKGDVKAHLKDVGNIDDAKPTSTKLSLTQLLDLGKEGLSDEEFIHTDVLKGLPTKDLKQNLKLLIGEAKNYLKEQIVKKVDIKELPKTLGGLIKLAEKSGIDVKAINFESLTQTAGKETLEQNLNLAKPIHQAQQTQQTQLPHSTSQLVKPAETKTSKESVNLKPLDALLNKTETTVNPIISLLNTEASKAPKASSPFDSALNALLHGEESEKTSEIETATPKSDTEKTQSVQHSKSDQLTQKITEAKQLVQNVAQNMKEMVENYKPPFTRIKMQLNPQKFGEMDVTLIQRGNNVHININANTTALTTMMQNSNELRAQLSAQGLGDATMNFSSHQQQQQEQEQQRQENAHLSYEEFQDFEEEFTEVATALEIVVPTYV